MKLSVYRDSVLAAACLGLLLLPVGCYQLSVSIEPESTEPETSSLLSTQTRSITKSPSIVPSAVVASDVIPNPTSSTPVFKYSSESTAQASGKGILRMSNQTPQPVRLALLARPFETSKDTAHWDFAPKEGIEKGLILSLPNGNLTLDKGDILVAFAQDGSRRYWGPYVVGETNFPVWNPQKQEWEMILK